MKQYLEKLYKDSKQNYYKYIDNRLIKNKKTFIVTANPETITYAEKDEKIKNILLDKNNSIVPDGIAVVKVSRKHNINIKERIPGVDIFEHLLKTASENKKSLYIFGSKQEVLDKMENVLKEKYPGIKILGLTNGYVTDRDKVFKEIIKKQPDIIAVALGIPQQEKLIYKYINQFKKGIFIGVGGSIDVLSGSKKRAPKFFIKTNTEWLYRIICEPKRIKRFYQNNIKFVLKSAPKKTTNFKKILKLIAIIISFSVLAALGYTAYYNHNSVPVLGYHSIVPKNNNTTGSSVVKDLENFEEEIKYLSNHNYKSLTLDEYYCWKEKKCKKHQKTVLITFDDGYYDNYEYAFDILKKYNMNAVVFVVGEVLINGNDTYIKETQFKEITKKYPNIEFASHSYNHHENRDVTYKEVIQDAKLMSEIIDTQYFAYPHGDYTDDYIKALKDSNYKLAFTFGPGKEHRKSKINDDNFKIPRLNVSNNMSKWKFILRLIFPM